MASPTQNGDADAARTRIGGPLDEANDAFHASYDDARGAEHARAVVFVLLADALVLCRGEARTERTVTPRVVHVLKSLAHIPPSLHARLARRGPGSSGDVVRGPRALLERVLATFADDLPDPAVRAELRPLLDESLRLLDEPSLPPARLSAYAARCGPLLLRATDHATRHQLTALDDAFTEMFAGLSADERARVEVVVTGDHQARARSLGMQYFAARFGEEPGEGERVAYGEGIDSVADALALIGKRRADRVLAQAFFGDAKRLQRDVLGDAARVQIAAAKLSRVV